ncbi:hypothetical protein [Flavobacterium sp.]|uniref:hypothetical protein n=1 Tax=Flavobacterium sp. TaxID=239 RepID=UPI003C482C27
MKKRLEADLISIAHRILQLKNKSDVNQLFLETQKLYEKLAVLRFVEEQYGETKPTIGQAAIIDDVATFYDNEDKLTPEVATVFEENVIVEEPIQEEVAITEEISIAPEEIVEEIQAIEESIIEVIPEEEIEEVIVAEEEEEQEEIVAEVPVVAEIVEEEKPKIVTPPAFKPAFELQKEDGNEGSKADEIAIETSKKTEAIQISFEDLLGSDYYEPQFVKVEDVPAIPKEPVFEAVNTISAIEAINTGKPVESATPKPVSLNDKFSKGIDIDLNDQIAFVKHLFGNSREDYNRVMSQLNTFNNFYETKAFIEEMVKPDYNDWKGKDDYEERFMDIIEKKFL